MSLDKLKAIVAPPAKPIGAGTPQGWKDAEKKFGTALPDDYKAIVDCYGIGWFDNWVIIFSPFYETFNLFKQHNRFQSSMQETVDSDPDNFPPYPLFPAKGGLLFAGQSENSDALCYVTDGKPNTWPIVTMHNDYTREFHDRFEMGLADLLVGWLSGKVRGECVKKLKNPKRARVFIPGIEADRKLMQSDG